MKYDDPNDIWEGITPCAVHLHHAEDCEACVAEMSARSARVDQMSADGARLMADIARQGGPGMPPWFQMEARLDVLIDTILSDPKDRLKFEGEVGRRLMKVIKQVHAETKQPTLVGANGQRLRPVKDTPQA